jgi:hypothetical protein
LFVRSPTFICFARLPEYANEVGGCGCFELRLPIGSSGAAREYLIVYCSRPNLRNRQTYRLTNETGKIWLVFVSLG